MSVLELRVCARYKLFEKIGGGQFGYIYRAQNAQNNLDCAIKMEEIKSKHPQVLYEGKIMQNLQGGKGIPSMYWCGQEGDFNFLVMEYLDKTLASLQTMCGGKFSLRTVLLIIDKVLKNVEYVHFKNYVHRDFKPENFMIGRGKNSNKFYTIDFGLSKKYIDNQTHQHIPWKDKKPLIGTARYASVNAHNGCELSRRDDLESLAYMFVYMLRGTLPWQGIEARTKDEKHIKVKKMKTNMSEEDICDGCPIQFAKFLKYVKSLKFEEKPNYVYIHKLFNSLAEQHNFIKDDVFDWWLIEKQSDVIPKNALDNYQNYLPYAEDIVEDEDEFLKNLNLEQFDDDEDLQYNPGVLPLDDIKLTPEERLTKDQMDKKLQSNWKEQQRQCIKILKEQQILVNEREMGLNRRASKKGLRYESVSSKQINAIDSQMVVTTQGDQQYQKQISSLQQQTSSNSKQYQIEDMSITQRQTTKPVLNHSSVTERPKPNHQKKKSQCEIF